MNKEKTRQYIEHKNFVASKKMGQNFLINQGIKQKIVDSALLDNNDLVIEIGPGLGAISEIILKKNNLLAIELDKRLYEFLKDKFNNNEKFNIINNDILKVDLKNEILNIFKYKKFNRYVVVANLPYSISSKIIDFLATNEFKINNAIIMVQKEMADRICSKPCTKQYNAFSAWLSICCKIKKLFDVSNQNFIPKPKVWSSVIKIDFDSKYDNKTLNEYKLFFYNCFQNKRKTLFNNLSLKFDKQKILDSFKKMNLDNLIRAESLGADKLIELYNNLIRD